MTEKEFTKEMKKYVDHQAKELFKEGDVTANRAFQFFISCGTRASFLMQR